MLLPTPPRPPPTAITCLTPSGGAPPGPSGAVPPLPGGTLGGGEDGIVIGRGTYYAPPRNVELPRSCSPGAVWLFEHEARDVSFPGGELARRIPDPFRDERRDPTGG